MNQTVPAELSTRLPVAEDDVAALRRDGHVVLREVVSRDTVEWCREAITRTAMQRNTETRSLAERDTYGKAFLQIQNLFTADPDVAAFVLAPRFGAIAADLMGAERVRIYHDQALFKEAGGGHTPWHQDAGYWPLEGRMCITMWMPLIDIEPEMGSLVFASGTGDAGSLTAELISDESDDAFGNLLAASDYRITEPIAMAAGDASFHLGWTAHMAPRNDSDRMREVMTVIWFADGLHVLEPASRAQQLDLERWLPGCAPGDRAESAINPLVELPND